MKRVEAILATTLALCLSGCVISKKPQPVAAAPVAPKPVPMAAPEPPPGPLSANQTEVDLPPLQPLTTEALATTVPPEETTAPVVARNTNTKRQKPSTTQATARPEPVGPTAPAPTLPPAVAESERPPIQPIVSPAELQHLQAEAEKIKKEIRQTLQPLGRRKLSAKDQDLKAQALSYLKQSDDAQAQGDMRTAYESARRGLVFAKALVEGR